MALAREPNEVARSAVLTDDTMDNAAYLERSEVAAVGRGRTKRCEERSRPQAANEEPIPLLAGCSYG